MCTGASVYDLHTYKCDSVSSEIELYVTFPKIHLLDGYQGFLCVTAGVRRLRALINIQHVKFLDWSSSVRRTARRHYRSQPTTFAQLVLIGLTMAVRLIQPLMEKSTRKAAGA